jgi:hypothetical protein
MLSIYETDNDFTQVRRNKMKSKLTVGGVFTIEHMRDGKLIDKWEEKNIVTAEGLDDMLNEALLAGGAGRVYYVGLFEGTHIPVDGDTHAVPGFTEVTVYTPAARVAWTGVAGSKQINNSAAKAVFTLTGSKTVTGAFLASTATQGPGAGNILFASSRFSAARAVIATDVLNITYTLQAASA